MALVAPAGPVYQAGTLSGNPLAMAAGTAQLELLRQPGVYERLDQLAARLASGMASAAREADIPHFQTRVGSMFCAFFTADPVTDEASAKRSDTQAFAMFFHAMLEAGVYLAPSQFEAGFVSLAHSEADVDETVVAARRALAVAAQRPHE